MFWWGGGAESPSGPTVVEADGSSTGTSTLAGVSGKIASVVSAATGAASAAVLASAIVLSSISSSGVASAQASGAYINSSTGSSTGTSSVQSNSLSVVAASSSSAGTSVASSNSLSVISVPASSNGTSSVNSDSSSVSSSVGGATSVSTVSASSTSISSSVASSSGTSSNLYTGNSVLSSDGVSSGSSSSLSTSSAISQSTASSSGTSSPVGSSSYYILSNGNSQGTCTTNFVLASIAQSAASSITTSSTTGVTSTILSSSGSVFGTSSSFGQSSFFAASVFNSIDTSLADGQSETVLAGYVANSSGSSTALGFGTLVVSAEFNSTGSSVVTSNSSLLRNSEFSSSGDSNTIFDAVVILPSNVLSEGTSTALFDSIHIIAASGNSDSHSDVNGRSELPPTKDVKVEIVKPAVRKPFFLPPRDKNILARQSNDLFKLAVSSITYFVRENSDKEPEDFLYLESAEQELVLGTKYSTRAFVKKVPLKATLKKFGLEEARDIYVEFRKDDLKRRSLPEPVVGSYFIVEKEFYKVTENSNDDYVDHYDHNINYSILGMKVKNSSFKEFEAVENKKQKTLFFSNQDKDNAIRQASDLFRVSVPSLTYFVREGADKEPEDLIYMESADQELVLGKQYSIRAFVRKVPLVATANKYGLEEMRNLEVGFKVDDFVKRSIPKPIIGSHFIVENEFYKVVNTTNSGYVDHLDNYIDYVVIGEKLRNYTFKDFEVLDGEKLSTLFFGSQDIKNLSNNHSFLFKKVFSMHTFIERKYDENVDLLYLENLDKSNLPGVRYELPAFVLTNPTKKKLLKFGIQEERDLQIELSVALSLEYLKKVDTVVGHGDGLPDIGSVMIFRGEPYIILDSTPQYYHGNTEAKIGKNLFAKKLKNSMFVDSKLSEISEEIIGAGSIDPYGG